MADLTLLMERASAGDREATRAFFKSFFITPLFVPDRHQPIPPKKDITYPSEFNYLLGVESEGRYIVPAFTSPELLAEWGGNLVYREITGERLLHVIPEEWYCVLNPGQEVEKEFTPWEIAQLRLGEGAIQEILDELALADSLIVRKTVGVMEGEGLALREALTEHARQIPPIRHLYLLKEECEDEEERVTIRYVVGVAVAASYSGQLDQHVEGVRRVCRIVQIGDTDVQVLGGLEGTHTLLLSMFQGVKPFYSVKKEPLDGLKAAIEAGYDSLTRFFTRRS